MRSVSSERMAAADAQLLWLSAKVPNDQFLVYVFDDEPDFPAALDELRRNAEGCGELQLRVVDDDRLRYPRWACRGIDPGQFVVHHAAGDWRSCLGAIGRLDQLDITRMAWRVHVFAPATVVVQVSHALGDGTRSAALAAVPVRPPARRSPPGDPGPRPLPVAGDQRGEGLPGPGPRHRGRRVESAPTPRPVLSINSRSSETPVLRTLVLDRAKLRPTVTVAALSAVGEALGGYLADRGEDVSRLGAEVPMAGPPTTKVRNNFRNVGIGLYPEADSGNVRRVSPPTSPRNAAAPSTPPPWLDRSLRGGARPLLRWGVSKFDPHARSQTVSATRWSPASTADRRI